MRKQKYYQQAFEVAREEVRSLDPAAIAARSGGTYHIRNGKKEMTVFFLGDPYTIGFPEIDITSPHKETISLVTRIVLLHYAIRADGTEPKGELIPYKEIPGGLMYAGVFQKRVVEPLIVDFGQTPERFLDAGIALGGEEAGFGDVSFSLRVLPRVSVTFVFWEGDEEFPPSIQVLFDRVIDRYLSLEDIVVLGEMTAKRLIAKGAGTK
ncbi:MAG: DUF3786 domain-containing protein [Proteobacteria bacterium]|nr:DUF3786 domain-containing protein [Pseudomonadota bacterium]